MKFGNVVLLCKGWYKYRSTNRPDLFWMDMAHAIDSDGWTVQSRNDVAAWCLHRLDDMRKDNKLQNYSNQFTFGYIFQEIENQLRRTSWYHDMEMSREDAIIWVFRDIVSNIENKYFDEGRIIPNKNVLQYELNEAWYDDGKYNYPDHTPKFHYAEMTCDYMDKVHEYFPEAVAQDIEDGRFNQVESFLHKDSWKDVVVLPGEDSLLDCIEIEITGKELKSRSIPNSEEYFELGNFEKCKDIKECKDPNKKYIVRIQKKKNNYWNTYDYTLKSVREA